MAKRVPKMTASDLQYALKELEAWRDGQRGRRLSWNLLEKATGFSRQTLCVKPELASLYAEAKSALAKGLPARRPKPEDFLEDKLEHLESELARYKQLEDQWLEKWVRIAFHSRAKNLSIDDFDKPLPAASRK